MLSRGRNGRRIVGPMGQEVMQSSGGRGDGEQAGWADREQEREREWMESASMNGGGMVASSGGF